MTPIVLDPNWVVPIVVAFIAATVGWGSSRVQKGTRENKLIDQLQEQLNNVEERLKNFEQRDRVYLPHIMRLNLHIEKGIGPPAPPLPAILAAYLTEDAT